jgi:hypothetical protein
VNIFSDTGIFGPDSTQRVVSEIASNTGPNLAYEITFSTDQATPTVVAPGATSTLSFLVATTYRDYAPVGYRPAFVNTQRGFNFTSPTNPRITDSYGKFLFSFLVNYATIGGGTPNASAGFTMPFAQISCTAGIAGTTALTKTSTRISPIVRNIAAWDPTFATTSQVSTMIPFQITLNSTPGNPLLLSLSITNQSNTAMTCVGFINVTSF